MGWITSMWVRDWNINPSTRFFVCFSPLYIYTFQGGSSKLLLKWNSLVTTSKHQEEISNLIHAMGFKTTTDFLLIMAYILLIQGILIILWNFQSTLTYVISFGRSICNFSNCLEVTMSLLAWERKKFFTIDFRSFQKGKGLESWELVCTKQAGTPDRSVFLVFKMAF